MKKLLFLCALLISIKLHTQPLYFPPLLGNSWETISTDELGWCQDSLTQLINYVGDNNSKAFIVLKGGKIAIEKYYGSFNQDSLWYWASAGKSVTSFIVGIAQQEGYLSIDNASNLYLGNGWSNCTQEQENNITVKNHLSMTTGLDDGVPNRDCTIDTCLNYLTDPGTRWAYHNGPYTLLDRVISGATGTTLNNYFQTRIRNRTAINGFYFQNGDNNVFFSTARSMARFGLLNLNKGVWQNDSIMTDQTYFQNMTHASQDLNKSYGFLWWLNGQESFMLPTMQNILAGPLLPDAPADMFCALGKNGQYALISPSEELVVIRMGDALNGINSLVPTLFANEIMKRLSNANCNPLSNKLNVKSTEFTIYPNPGNGRITLVSNNFNEVKTILVMDALGRIVFQTKNTNQIDISNLLNGFYTISVTDKLENFHLLKYVLN